MSHDFFAAYDPFLVRWPTGTTEIDVPTPYGITRVHAYGPVDATPVLLLHGGGSTGAVWFANAPVLGTHHRVLAVDILGDAGRSIPGGRPLRTTTDLMVWLDALLDGLAVSRTHLLGHSYGGWIALTYALHSAPRVDRLVLLDPTQCFAGFRPSSCCARCRYCCARRRPVRAPSWTAGPRGPTPTWTGSGSMPWRSRPSRTADWSSAAARTPRH